jgi:hypothetical protein
VHEVNVVGENGPGVPPLRSTLLFKRSNDTNRHVLIKF